MNKNRHYSHFYNIFLIFTEFMTNVVSNALMSDMKQFWNLIIWIGLLIYMLHIKTKMCKAPELSNDILDDYAGAAGKNKIFTIGLKKWFKIRL